jgi:uncharacterized protein YdhG (YjbR/CyaY superfamily)
MASTENIDDYIANYPAPVQAILQEIRQVIHTAAPDAVEAISYAIPTFKLRGKNLVHFGAFKHHIGFYPTPSGAEAFSADLAAYKQGKGSVQFPLDQPMPCALIRRIVLFRMNEVEKRTAKAKK